MKRPVLVLVLAGALALTGCAQSGGSTAAPGPASPDPTPVATLPPTPIAGCTGTIPSEPVVVTERQNNTAYCVPTGTHLEIYLQGTADDKWSQPASDSPVLRPEPSGRGALKLGVTAAFYVADHAGQAKVTATRDGTRFEITVRVV
jgi:hypothetical protein